jgi:DNA ligase (NAD+)
MDGWGTQSVSNLKYSIDLRKKISLERFIYALGIRHIGLENAKLISKYLKNKKRFLELSEPNNLNELSNIDGIGETQIKSIKNFFNNITNLRVIKELKEILEIKDSVEFKKDGLFKDKTFMLTGKLDGISRAEAKSLIEQNSGSIISNVSKKLNYLIVGEKPTKRKIESAKELQIKILNQVDWLKMLNKRG